MFENKVKHHVMLWVSTLHKKDLQKKREYSNVIIVPNENLKGS